MSGHRHNPNAATQNQGNALGDRACVRQSKLYRVHESGNDIKSLLGTSHLCWDTTQKQGAYNGQQVYDHLKDDPLGVNNSHAAAQDEARNNRYRPMQDGSGNFYSGYNEGEAQQQQQQRGAPRRQQQQQPQGGEKYETSSSSYGREGTGRIGKYGFEEDEPRGGARRDDYARRGSFDREPASHNEGGRRGSFHNDENQYREKNQLSHYQPTGNSGGYDSGSKGREDKNYRNVREQMDNSSYQRAPRNEPQPDVERSAIRTYKGKDKDTRPW